MLRGVKEPESIADHMYRMSMMAFVAPANLDRSKLIDMCLIHDLPESIVGDLTPSDNVSKESKHELEMVKKTRPFTVYFDLYFKKHVCEKTSRP